MELYLIRHGIAAERGTYPKDEERPLTEKGRAKTQKVAQRLYALGLRFDFILTSPLVRARQTAEILKKAGLGDRLETFTPLAPQGKLEQWLGWCHDQYSQGKGPLALVGHQPELGNWAETLVWGSVKEQLVLKKAGVIGIEVSQSEPIGRSQLFVVTSPKWLL